MVELPQFRRLYVIRLDVFIIFKLAIFIEYITDFNNLYIFILIRIISLFVSEAF